MSAPIVLDPIVLGLGGNVGADAAIIGRFQRARDALAALGEIRSAALYRTAALAPGQPPQPAFLNTAVRLRMPEVQPRELIAVVLEIERLLGRDREHEARWGPRPIDIDVLVWGARVVRDPDLEVPHPRLGERRFALAPLVDLLGEHFEIPGIGAAGVALARVSGQQLERLADGW